MINKVWQLAFRPPEHGEFGFKHLKNTGYYVVLQKGSLPLKECLGLDGGPQIAWDGILVNAIQSTFAETIDIDYGSTDFLKNGTHDYDDLDINISTAYHTIFTAQQTGGSLLTTKTLLENRTQRFFVLNSKIKKQDLLNEIKDHCVLRKSSDFFAYINFLAAHKYEKVDFASRKQVISMFASTNGVRATDGLDGVINKHWQQNMLGKNEIYIGNIIPGSDTEEVIIGFFQEHYLKNYNSIGLSFLDERNLLEISSKPIENIELESVITINRVKNSTIPTTFLVLGYKASKDNKEESNNTKLMTQGSNIFLLCGISVAGSALNVYCLNNLSDKNGIVKLSYTTNLEVSKKICDVVRTHTLQSEDEIPGQVTGIDIEKEEILFADILSTGSEANAWLIEDIFLVALKKDIHLTNWIANLKKNISFNIKDQTMKSVGIVTAPTVYGSLDHTRLNKIDSILAECVKFEDKKQQWHHNIKSNNEILEKRTSILASKLSFIYETMKPLLDNHLKFILCYPKIDRGYIIVGNDLVNGGTIQVDKNINVNGALQIAIDDKAYVSPSFNMFMSLLKLIPALGKAEYDNTMKMMFEKPLNEIFKMDFKHVSSENIINTIVSHITDNEKAKKVREAGEKDTIKVLQLSSSLGVINVNTDLFTNDTIDIFNILMHVHVQSYIENGTFLNLNKKDNTSLMTSEDIIFSALRDNLYTKLTLIKSQYA